MINRSEFFALLQARRRALLDDIKSEKSQAATQHVARHAVMRDALPNLQSLNTTERDHEMTNNVDLFEVERTARARWASDPKIREEFRSADVYAAYMRAYENGQVKFSGHRNVSTERR